MEKQIDLKNLERRIFHAFLDDGLLEIFIGVLFLSAMGGAVLTSIGASHRWTYLMIGAAVLAFSWAKKAVTLPRLGRVKFGPKRRADRGKMLAALVVIQVVTAVVLWLAWSDSFPAGSNAGPGLFVRHILTGFVLFTVPFGTLAYFLENPRMLIPAFLGCLNESLRGLVPGLWNAGFTFGIGGVVLAGLGTAMWVRFVRANPMPEREA